MTESGFGTPPAQKSFQIDSIWFRISPTSIDARPHPSRATEQDARRSIWGIRADLLLNALRISECIAVRIRSLSFSIAV
jgi:hypothetical protein